MSAILAQLAKKVEQSAVLSGGHSPPYKNARLIY